MPLKPSARAASAMRNPASASLAWRTGCSIASIRAHARSAGLAHAHGREDRPALRRPWPRRRRAPMACASLAHPIGRQRRDARVEIIGEARQHFLADARGSNRAAARSSRNTGRQNCSHPRSHRALRRAGEDPPARGIATARCHPRRYPPSPSRDPRAACSCRAPGCVPSAQLVLRLALIAIRPQPCHAGDPGGGLQARRQGRARSMTTASAPVSRGFDRSSLSFSAGIRIHDRIRSLRR